jgi:RimJ/RimL family protein N-acetyltransferase
MLKDLRTLPAIETARLRLRPLGGDDAEALAAISGDPLILEAIYFLPDPFGPEQARALILARGDGRDCFVGVWSKASGELMGVLGVHLQGEERIEIGYWLGVAFHGRGYTTEAGEAMIAHLADAAPARRVVAHALPTNLRSLRVLEKLGFRPSEGPPSRPERNLYELAR